MKTLQTTATVIAFSIAGLAVAGQAQAKDITPFTAQYSFAVKDKISGKGKATRKLTKSGNNWSYRTSAYAFGGIAKANQTTRFSLKNNKVKPRSASTSYKILGKSKRHKIKFNNKSVVSTYKGKSKTLRMPRQAHDELSLEVQIRQDLLNGKFRGTYYRVSKDKVVKTRFRKSGTTTIKTRAGTYKAVRIDRIHTNKSRRTSFWLAPKLDYLPVKIVTRNKKSRVKLVLTKLRK